MFDFIKTYTAKEIEILKQVGSLHSNLQKTLYDLIEVGKNGEDLEQASIAFFKETNSTSAFKNFQGYPKHICVSINDELIHGIPNKTHMFKHRDIISVDIGIKYNGYLVDGAFSVLVSNKGEEESLLETKEYNLVLKTWQALKNSLTNEPKRIGDFCKSFDEVVSKENYFLTDEYSGHGVGKSLHEQPQIPNSLNTKNFTNWKLKNGMVLAIEPMVFEKESKTKVCKDKWTVRSENGALNAHFEETIAIINDKIISLNPFKKLTNVMLIKS